LLAVAVLLAKRATMAVGLAAAHAGCLAAALLALAWLQGSVALLAVAAFSLAAKAIALPLGLRPFVPALDQLAATGRVAGRAMAAVALAGLAVAVAAPAVGNLAGGNLAGLALAVVAIGALAAALPGGDSGPSLGPALGVLVLENGLVLALAVLAPASVAAPLVVATAMLPAAALWLLLRPLLPGRGGG